MSEFVFRTIIFAFSTRKNPYRYSSKPFQGYRVFENCWGYRVGKYQFCHVGIYARYNNIRIQHAKKPLYLDIVSSFFEDIEIFGIGERTELENINLFMSEFKLVTIIFAFSTPKKPIY